jgi:very-short-patch-repair endonuclease
MVESGQLERALPGVLGYPGAPRSWERALAGACLWAGQGSAASHRAAAARWGLDGFARGPVEISTVGRKRPPGGGMVVHHVSHFLLQDIVELSSIPITSVRRTLLDLAGRKHPRTERAVDHALLQRMVSLGQLWLLYEEAWTRRRRGIAILREMLCHRTPGQAPTHSDLERMFDQLVRDFSLPLPTRQWPVDLPMGRVHIDFSYPDALLAIELDSYAWHMNRAAFERDRERDNQLQRLGWRVLRFTWAKLKWDREGVAELVRAHLDERLG